MNRGRPNYHLEPRIQELSSSQSQGVLSQSLNERGKYRLESNNEEVLSSDFPTNQHQANGSNENQAKGKYRLEPDDQTFLLSSFSTNQHYAASCNDIGRGQYRSECNNERVLASSTSHHQESESNENQGIGNYLESNNHIRPADLPRTSQYSSEQIDGAYSLPGNYLENNNHIRPADLLRTSQYSSEQIDGAYSLPGNYLENNNHIRPPDLLRTSQYSSEQIDGVYSLPGNYFESNNLIRPTDLLRTSQSSSEKTDGVYYLPGHYFESNNPIRPLDLPRTSQFSSKQIDGAFSLPGNYFESNNHIRPPDLPRTSQYSSEQIDGAYSLPGNCFESNNHIRPPYLPRTSQYLSEQIDGAYSLPECTRNLRCNQYDLWNTKPLWKIPDCKSSDFWTVPESGGRLVNRKDKNTYINLEVQNLLGPEASVYVPITNPTVILNPPDGSFGEGAASVDETVKTKPTCHSQYVDSIWKIICRDCYFVSECRGLENHVCSQSGYISGTISRQCDTCLMPLPEGESLENHQNSRLHILFLINRRFDYEKEKLLAYYCYYCNVQSFSENEHFQHTITHNHFQKFKLLHPFFKSFCLTCQLYFDREGNDIHLSSRVHLMQSIVNFNSYISKFQRTTFCALCKVDCMTNTNYLEHITSYQHVCSEFQNKIANTNIRNFKYICKIEEGFKCMVCKLFIAYDYLVPIHLNIDAHIINVKKYEDLKITSLTKAVTVTKNVMPFDPCEDCRTKERTCDHVFKDCMSYLLCQKEHMMLKYCYLCNTAKTETHELTNLHRILSANLYYCETCDITSLFGEDDHIKRYRHKQIFEEFGILGYSVKYGIRNPTWNCKVCNCTVNNNENEIMEHLDSIRHKDSFHTFLTEDAIIECKLCRFATQDSELYNNHSISDSHLENVSTLKQDRSKNYCYVCENNVLSWRKHLVHPLHVLKLSAFKM